MPDLPFTFVRRRFDFEQLPERFAASPMNDSGRGTNFLITETCRILL